MIAKIAILFAVVAVATAGVVVSSGPVVAGLPHSPASTVKLANVVQYAAVPAIHQTYAAGPIAYSAPAIHAAPVAVGGPIAYTSGVVAGPAVVSGPVTYSTGAKVVQTFEPVEQHGYKIAY